MKKEFMIVLLGSDENAYSLGRDIYSLYKIKPIVLTTKALEPTKYSNILDIVEDPLLHKEEHLTITLIDLGKKLKREYEKILLIPISNLYMEYVIKYRELLKDFENNFISFEKYKFLIDKDNFYKICDKYDIKHPSTFVCNPKNYKKVVNKLKLEYPLILKPLDSKSKEYKMAEFENKEKVYIINDKFELLSCVENIYSSSYQKPLLLQEYISGDDTSTMVINFYSDKRGKVKLISSGQTILKDMHPKTYGDYVAIISKKENPKIAEDIKTFLEKIRYRGASNFYVKRCTKTEEYYCLGMNLKPSNTYFTSVSSMSIAKAYVDDLIYDDIEPTFCNAREILWLNVPYAILLKCLHDNNLLSKIKDLKKENNVFHTLYNKEDRTFRRNYIKSIYYLRKMRYFPKYQIDKK